MLLRNFLMRSRYDMLMLLWSKLLLFNHWHLLKKLS